MALFYASACRGSKVRRRGGDGKLIGRGRFRTGVLCGARRAGLHKSVDFCCVSFYLCSQLQIDPRGRNRAGDGEVLPLVFLFEFYLAEVVARRFIGVVRSYEIERADKWDTSNGTLDPCLACLA
jgi:hypothetical protein